jgi:putative restriction endonuclease
MTPDILIRKFSDLRTWGTGGRRAPNKPLLILLALGKLESEKVKRLSFADIEESYRTLLRNYGRTGNPNPHPEHAFYRLANDCDGSIWSIRDPNNVLVQNSSGDVRISDLRSPKIEAGFSPDIIETFDRNPDLAGRLAKHILSDHFPSSLHPDILNSVGITPPNSGILPRRRGQKFRPNVLAAYGHQCAVCRFSMRLNDVSVALEAAHIKWHQAGGPDEIYNGLALCCLHHKLFDCGAFTISEDFRLEASPWVNSTGEGENAIFDFDGKDVLVPKIPERHPHGEFLRWHKSEVFKS